MYMTRGFEGDAARGPTFDSTAHGPGGAAVHLERFDPGMRR
ncbi:MAG TPA: hypothetical protein VK960_06250 [Acidimicrobiia bacterium]|nr:hypothetical protein [Acidimicrobiia bacterium]